MFSEFSRWFKEAVKELGSSGHAEGNESQRQSGNRYLYETGVWNGDIAFSAELGQVVWIEVRNVNVLGTTITIDSDRDGYRSIHLLPFMSHIFKFNHLVFNDMASDVVVWGFQVSTISDAFVVQYAIYSTWIPGLPE